MGTLSRSVPLILNASLSRIETPLIPVSALTSGISIRIQRPTTAVPVAWDATSKLRVTLRFLVDGVEYRTIGTVSGGIREKSPGIEAAEYLLRYRPTVLFAQRALDYLATATPDENGFYANVPLTRLGELGTTVKAGFILERLSGSISTMITASVTLEAPAPVIARHHNSVAFDAATEGYEAGGDGVLSVSHTASGTNRAVFIGSGIYSVDSVTGTTSISYGGASATELWDASVAGSYGNAGYALVAPATGAQTVTATAADATPEEQGISVISMTGVHQATPTGTAVTATGTSAAPSVTVSAPAADSLVVDNLITEAMPRDTVGANQTERTSPGGTDFLFQYGSTQLGSSGGVMSWTLVTTSGWRIGAVEFKAAGAGGSNNGAAVRHYRRMTGIG